MKLLKLEVRNFKPFRDLVLPQEEMEFPEPPIPGIKGLIEPLRNTFE